MDLSGTDGYWFITSEEVSFSYNPPLEGSARKVSPVRAVPMAYSYDQSMEQAFYFINSATINGDPLEESDLVIAYNGDVVVGARYWSSDVIDVPAMGFDENLENTSDYARLGDEISFKVYDSSEDFLIDMTVEGDALWKIAYQRLGGGDKYFDILKLNKDAIKNPDLIFPKQLFVLPK